MIKGERTMAANRAALAETINRGRSKPSAAAADKSVNLRLAQGVESGRGRVRRLVDLASASIREAQVFARGNAVADGSAPLQNDDLSKKIHFHNEVQRF